MDDINEESLSLFTALEPKLDLLIIGIGDQTASPSFSKKILSFMKKYKINVEVLRTEQASKSSSKLIETVSNNFVFLSFYLIFRLVLRSIF